MVKYTNNCTPCCAIVCVFHHVVQLFVYFTMLCNCLCISSCCAIICVFHHVVQLFVYFTMLCNCLCISPCCAIVCVFHHVVQLFMNLLGMLFRCCLQKFH